MIRRSGPRRKPVRRGNDTYSGHSLRTNMDNDLHLRQTILPKKQNVFCNVHGVNVTFDELA